MFQRNASLESLGAADQRSLPFTPKGSHSPLNSMSDIFEDLKKGKCLHDVARALGYDPAKLSYVIYVLPESKRYTSFDIPKKNGEIRSIQAPCDELKLLQSRLAEALKSRRKPGSIGHSHGFEVERWIATNSNVHRNKRHVLNIDLKDFFGSINFGRVRGCFHKSDKLKFHLDVATVLAQVAVFENKLPQGSPSSPVISNFVAGSLDFRLACLAKKFRCNFTRYADDITFSTNQKKFPEELGVIQEGKCVVGEYLRVCVEKSGFEVKNNKCYLFSDSNRKVVTGLVCNEFPNVKREYYKTTRAMVSNLYQNGEYEYGDCLWPVDVYPPLRGRLSHIHHVSRYNDEKKRKASTVKKEEPTAKMEVYKKFLIYSELLFPLKHTIICEGETDKVYLKSAMKNGVLHGFPDVNILNYSNEIKSVLGITGGTPPLVKLLIAADEYSKKVHHGNKSNACIVLLDNDSGLNAFKGFFKYRGVDLKASRTGFYNVFSNVYCVVIPVFGSQSDTEIEHYFPASLLQTKLSGKKLSLKSKINPVTEYGKAAFAKNVVLPNQGSINYKEFVPMFKLLQDTIENQERK